MGNWKHLNLQRSARNVVAILFSFLPGFKSFYDLVFIVKSIGFQVISNVLNSWKSY